MIEYNEIQKDEIEIQDIVRPVEKEFIRFQESYRSTLNSDVEILNLITQYIVNQRGKQIRPMLVLLTSGLFGTVNERSIHGAVLVEILHNATLVHDDIVDESQFRRGEPTVNEIWKSKISVLVGDYLLSKSLIGASELGNLEVVKTLADATRRMSQGEIVQIHSSQSMNINEENYFKLIADKTAALFSACCLIGAEAMDASLKEKKLIAQCGEDLGIAFQIKDDLLDMLGAEKFIGKPKLADITSNRLTLPMIYALRATSKNERDAMLGLLKKEVMKEEIPSILSFIENYGGFEYTKKKCEEYADKAREALIQFRESPGRDSLDLLIEYVVSRSR